MSGLVNALCLNKLGMVDTVFFIVCALIIVLIVAVYFLIPVFNKKLYKEQRDNLHKREVAFKSNLKQNQTAGMNEEQEADNGTSDVSSDE